MINIQHLLANKTHILGMDEVGTGSWCHSIVVCGIKAPIDWSMLELNDSKKLTPLKRYAARDKLLSDNVINWGRAERSHAEIDREGLANALQQAYIEVMLALYSAECLIITDGNLIFNDSRLVNFDRISIVKADSLYPTVMAASILAKTYRDEQMIALHDQYPVYNWKQNKGYGSSQHKQALIKHGISPLHRLSYEPMKSMVKL